MVLQSKEISINFGTLGRSTHPKQQLDDARHHLRPIGSLLSHLSSSFHLTQSLTPGFLSKFGDLFNQQLHLLLIVFVCDCLNFREAEGIVDSHGCRLGLPAVLEVVRLAAAYDGWVDHVRGEVLPRQLLQLPRVQLLLVRQQQFDDFEATCQVVHRVDIALVDEAGRGEKVRGEIGPVELPHFVQFHVEALSLLGDLEVDQSVNHLGEESPETGLVAPDGQRWVGDHLLNVLFTGIKAKHDYLLDLVLENFDDG